jgi:aminopeptidase-like protein
MNIKKIFNTIQELYPINRSLAGSKINQSFEILQNIHSNFKIKKIKSRTKIYDWEVPDEWEVQDAYISNSRKEKIINYKKNNLYLSSYSSSINLKNIKLKKIKKKLFFIKSLPNAIPYRTNYYKKNCNFNISYNEFKKNFKYNDLYNLFVDSKFKIGNLKYIESYIPGKTKKEILFTSYLCHPSMVNNELIAPVILSYFANLIKSKKNIFSYRILICPETIGSISFISKNIKYLKKNLAGCFVINCFGGKSKFKIISSRYGNTFADKISQSVLGYDKNTILSFLDRGSDERQFCSPLIDLPTVSIVKSKHGDYKEYHTSLDDMKFANPKFLKEGSDLIVNLYKYIENRKTYMSNINCEPMLSKYKLFKNHQYARELLDVFNYCDGTNDINDIHRIIKLNKKKIKQILNTLIKKKIIKVCTI